MNPSRICILLATYNGEKYLSEQLLSLQNQTLQDWTLIVRDDGSTDGTVELVANLAANDTRITLLVPDGAGGLGAAQNFGKLMEAGLQTDAQIFFFCDQDDVWEAVKLERQVLDFPGHGGEVSPLLVHSDLSVVDEDLVPIHPSLADHMALDASPDRPLNCLLTRNFVTGCATACNRRLLEQATPIPNAAIMHDWWLALIAASSGAIRYINEPLVKYRQHEANTIGATGFWHLLSPRRNWARIWQAGNGEFLATFEQAAGLLDHAGAHHDWPEANTALINSYSQLLTLSAAKRLSAAKKLGLRQGEALLKLVYYLRLLTLKVD
ncbi:MAG: glycosyltransferase family 2 protein [Halioglobus sp.]